MRITIIVTFASCVVLLAQSNIDSSGYVTNANLLTPFTLTNSSGNVVTDAVLVKLTPNQFIYKTPNGGMGMMRLDLLPKELQEKFGFDPQAAHAADEADKKKKARQQQYAQRQREIAAMQEAQSAIWKQVETNRNMFAVTGDSLKVEQVTKDGVLASYNLLDVEGIPRSLRYFVKGIPNQDALIDGATISGPFYKIGTYSYTSVMGASETIKCLTCSPQLAFNYYSVQAGVEVSKANDMAQQQLEQQRQEAAVPQTQRDIVWQRVKAHERSFDGFMLTVRQITKDGIVASCDQDTDAPGQNYFVKDYSGKESLYAGSSPNTLQPPFYEIGTYTYTTVMGANKTLQCLTCSSHVAFQYYLNH